MATKTQLIQEALERGDRLTHLKAIAYGTYRLADVIFRLKKKGLDIRTETKTDGAGTQFAEYSLVRKGHYI